VILNRINIKKEYKQAGFESFADYMNERQPCGIKMRHAYELIAAMKLRPLLPDCATGAKNEPSVWTERAIRPLLHKDFTPADQKRIGKKIATAWLLAEQQWCEEQKRGRAAFPAEQQGIA
jgi:hypothetical protein